MKATEFIGAPALSSDQEWSIVGYLHGKATRQMPSKTSMFTTAEFLGQSAEFYHFIGDGRTVLICSIKFKSPSREGTITA